MRWLINYIKSCFCSHEWEHVIRVKHMSYEMMKPIGYQDVYRCKKCGYVKKFNI